MATFSWRATRLVWWATVKIVQLSFLLTIAVWCVQWHDVLLHSTPVVPVMPLLTYFDGKFINYTLCTGTAAACDQDIFEFDIWKHVQCSSQEWGETERSLAHFLELAVPIREILPATSRWAWANYLRQFIQASLFYLLDHASVLFVDTFTCFLMATRYIRVFIRAIEPPVPFECLYGGYAILMFIGHTLARYMLIMAHALVIETVRWLISSAVRHIGPSRSRPQPHTAELAEPARLPKLDDTALGDRTISTTLEYTET